MTSPIGSPSEHGIDPHALAAFIDAVEDDPRIEPHGLIVQRHGCRVLETYWRPHRAGQLRLVYSLSKSFTGVALGLAVGDGVVSLDDPVATHLGDLMVDAGPRTRRTLIRHVASMATGHDDETLLDAFVAHPEDPLRGYFTLEPDHEPGTWFAYNQPPVLALSEVLSRRTGRRLVDQLRRRVLEPIGIRDLRWYQYRPGVDLGFSGVFTDLDAIARLGQLHLDRGIWADQRILPAAWIAEASRPQISNAQRPEPDWSRGYGFQLWMCRHGFRGDGAFGQYMVVLPDHDAVVAFFSHTEEMQSFMDLVWDRLLPAFDPIHGPAPTGDAALRERTVDLRHPGAAQRSGWIAPPRRAADGDYHRAEGVPSHPSIDRAVVHDGYLLLHEGEVVTRVPLTTDWTDVAGTEMSASAAADDTGRLTVDLVVRSTPHRLVLTTDPPSSSFTATWPSPPLFGMGLDPVLARMGPPEA